MRLWDVYSLISTFIVSCVILATLVCVVWEYVVWPIAATISYFAVLLVAVRRGGQLKALDWVRLPEGVVREWWSFLTKPYFSEKSGKVKGDGDHGFVWRGVFDYEIW